MRRAAQEQARDIAQPAAARDDQIGANLVSIFNDAGSRIAFANLCGDVIHPAGFRDLNTFRKHLFGGFCTSAGLGMSTTA